MKEQTEEELMRALRTALDWPEEFKWTVGESIDWDALREELKDAPILISPKERCELLLRYANTGGLMADEWDQLVGIRATQPSPKGGQRQIALPQRLEQLRSFLDVIVNGPATKRALLDEHFHQAINGRLLVAPIWKSGGYREERVVASSVPAALTYGIWLLADPKLPFRRALARCQYSECRKFFIVERGRGKRGPPMRRFCSLDHAEHGVREAAQQRMAKNRRKHK